MTQQQNTRHSTPEQHELGEASPLLVLFLLVPLIGILIALIVVANQLRIERDTAANMDPTTLTDSAAPDFELPNLAGDSVSLSDYRGKIVFLNFWQTTCPPCLRELPDFVTFMAEQDEDVTWLTVNVGETRGTIRAFFAAHEFSGIPVVMDRDSTLRQTYAVIGFPITYVLDAEGIIRYTSIGALSYEQMNEILAEVRAGT